MDKPDKMQWCSKRASEANIASSERMRALEDEAAAKLWDPEDFFDEYDELYGEGK